MGNHDHMLQRLQFQTHYDAAKNHWQDSAHFAGRPDFEVGHIHWDADTGEIKHIHTQKEFRGNGIANHMYAHAKQLDLKVRHSANRTPDGDKWARQTGDTVPPLRSERALGGSE